MSILLVRHAFDEQHRPRAERAAKLTALERLFGWRNGVQHRTAAQQRGGTSAIGEEAEVADADQALRQDVDEEPPQEQ